MGWFRVSEGRMAYGRRITREPFNRWMGTTEGAASVARMASGIRFSLIGRSSAARRRIWLAVEAASRTEALASALAGEPTRYMQAFASLAYSDALPRVHIALHRLVLIPRAMIAPRARADLFRRLAAAPPLAALDEPTRAFFLDRTVVELDAALHDARPSPRNPVHAHEQWACVGVAKELVWADAVFSGTDATGHVFVYEFPRPGMPQPTLKDLKCGIAEMAAGASALTRLQRFALVRAATAR
jgi:hypothetical protein